MKPNLPRSWFSLPKKEQQAITEACTKAVHATVDHEEAELQKIWLQLACIVIHKLFGIGKTRGLRFLREWKRVYRITSACETNAQRDEWLKAEMEKIFGKDGYPHEWVDSLEKGGRRE